MPGPLIATVIRGLIGRQAARGAVQSGARGAARQAGRRKAAETAGGAASGASGEKPGISNIFRILTEGIGKGAKQAAGPQRPAEAVSRRPPAAGPQRPAEAVSRRPPAAGPKSAEPRGLQRLASGFERFLGLSEALPGRKGKGAERPQLSPGPPAASAKKPDIDFSKMIGMMGQPGAREQLEQEAAEKQRAQQIADQKAKQAAQEAAESSRTLGGRLRTLTDNVFATAGGILHLLGTVTGLSDAKEALSSLIKGDLTNAAKSGTRAMVKFALIAVTLPFAIKRWSDALVESRRELVRYNSRIAAAIARLDYQQFRLNVRQAAATQASTIRLMNAVEEFNEDFQPLREDARTIVNTLAFIAVKIGQGTLILTEILKKQFPLAPLLGQILKELEEEVPEQDFTLPQVLDAMRNVQGQPPPDPLPPMF